MRVAIAFLMLFGANVARAQPEEPGQRPASQPTASRVIQVRDGEIYINVDGRTARGATLEVYREETMVDPATNTPLKDRFRVATLRLLRGGDRFSVTRAPEGVEVKVGDLVVVRPRAARRALQAPPAAVPPTVAASLSGRPAPAPVPVAYKSADEQRRERLLDANLGTTNRLAFGGGHVSYGGKDRFGQFEGEYTHFFFHSVVHSIQFGGGGLLGDTYLESYNPAASRTDRTLEPVRFYYGLAGLDLTFTEWFGADMEVVFGVTADGVGGGALGAFRIGQRDGVNVRLGGWLRSYIGHEGFLALEIPVGRRFRLTPRVAIDNMPLGEDTGFSALLKGELRLGRHFGVTAEIGGAARDANTGGFAANGGLVFHM
jgi:hypothetical protein